MGRKFFISGEIGFFPDEASADFRTVICELQGKIEPLMEKNDYGGAVMHLGVIPTIYPQWMLDKQKESGKEIKERRLLRKGDVDHRLFINQEAFVTGDLKQRRRLLIENVITVIRELGQRIKKGFDADRLEKDVRRELGYDG